MTTTDYAISASRPDARLTFKTYTKEQESFAAAMSGGFRRRQKRIPCRFLYDQRGSELFDQICELDEYYPTRTETAILEANAAAIAKCVGAKASLVELGSGSSVKTRILLDALKDLACYAPIDVSREHLGATAKQLADDYPKLRIEAICADYSDDFPLPKHGVRNVAFFPGSTIGNLDRADALALLKSWRARIGKGGLMIIGIDLKKDAAVLEAAYDDSDGVTEAFIRNVLTRANSELGADFDVAAYDYEARWEPGPGRVEMHLRSSKDQVVEIGGETVLLKAGERIHIENSHKYSIEEAQALGAAAGFTALECFTDPARKFSVHIWAA
jgi:dimethylhistidine N-methyltransferase